MIGIIIFSYGAPMSMDDLNAYYAHIRKGKKQTPEMMKAVKDRFRRIGTGDTLGRITMRQAQALEHALEVHFPEDIKVYTAFRHTTPFIDQTVQKMVDDGIRKIYTFSLKPLESKLGTILYQKLVRKAVNEIDATIPVIDIADWHVDNQWIGVLSERVRAAYEWLPKEARENAVVIFTVHSLAGTKEIHQEYDQRLAKLAEIVATDAAIEKWTYAYRSAGEQQGAWSGPDIKDVIKRKKQAGFKAIIAFDLQSLTSNIETEYDIGYDLQDLCKELDLEFIRATPPNDSYEFIIALSEIIKAQIE